MRENKFRGKRLGGEGWVYGVPVFYGDGTFIANPTLTSNGGRNWQIEAEEVVPESVVQFTGLQDKNGKDIYEGDVLDIYDFRGKVMPENRSVVAWSKAHCGFVLKSGTLTGVFEKHYEVIGNVHQNPGLLEASQ